MRFDNLIKYIKILKYLFSGSGIKLGDLEPELEISYFTLVGIFNKWLDSDIVYRKAYASPTGSLGYLYYLSDKGYRELNTIFSGLSDYPPNDNLDGYRANAGIEDFIIELSEEINHLLKGDDLIEFQKIIKRNLVG